MASAQPAWSWQATEALLARLSPPTAAALHSEYANCQRLTAWLNSDPLTAHFDQLTASQRSGVLQRWCALAQPLLQVIPHQADQITSTCPAAFSAVGVLLNGLGVFLERCVHQEAAEQQAAVQQQITQHTAGLAPVLGPIMATIAAQLGRVTPQQRAATIGAAATADRFRNYFPTHSDVCMAAHLLAFWKSLAMVWPGSLLRSSSSSSSSSSRRARSSSSGSSSSSSSSSSLQETVLPACDLAVNLLKTWPPTKPGTAPSSSSSSSGEVRDAFMPRDPVTAIINGISHVLLVAVHGELLMDDSPNSPRDASFAQQLSDSASLQHLLLISVAAECHRSHRELRGVSPVKTKTAAAVVTASPAVAAAAAAAEAAASDQQQQRQQQQEQQLYLTVPAHHTAVLEMLLAPAVPAELDVISKPKLKLLRHALYIAVDFLLLGSSSNSSSSSNGRRLGMVMQLPRIPVEMCPPLHLLVCEAAALAPELRCLHSALIFQMSLLDIHMQAKIPDPPTAATINAAAAAYSDGLTASLLLMGPALLHAVKHSKDGDVQMPAGGGGCPLGPGGVFLKGAALKDAAVNLFGSVIMKICPPFVASQGMVSAAFRQQPFTAAAVCEAAVRGAARHNQMNPGHVRFFAALATAACLETIHPPAGSSSSRRSIVAAAASDAGLRDALLLQFGLITTHIKQAAGSVEGISSINALFSIARPSANTALALSKLMEAAIGMDSNEAIGGLGSGRSRDEEEDDDAAAAAARVEAMAPWLALAGRCLYFAGSTLLLAMESPAAAAAPNTTAAALEPMQQVLTGLFGCALVTGAQIHELQVMSPDGWILPGPKDDGHTALETLLDTMEAATKQLERALARWKTASKQSVRNLAGNSTPGVWGKLLQAQLKACLGPAAAAQIRDAGAAVMAEFPVKLCCNNPGCSSMGKLGELQLGQGCSGCRAAKYCSRECQLAHWKVGHQGVCKRIKAAAAAAAGGAAAAGVQ